VCNGYARQISGLFMADREAILPVEWTKVTGASSALRQPTLAIDREASFSQAHAVL